MKKRLVFLTLAVVTLILEILPYGAVCNFANQDGSTIRKTYSYFNMTPFGYANLGPFLTAILTCAVLVVVLIFCITGNRKLLTSAKIILSISVLSSLAPLAYGVRCFSIVGALITVSIILELALLCLYKEQ